VRLLAFWVLASFRLTRVGPVLKLSVAPATVQSAMEKGTSFRIVALINFALFNFKKFEIQMVTALSVNNK